MEGHVNTYGGMNKDTAYDTIKPNLYIDALDIRISTDKGESQGAFTNIKGNLYGFTIPTSGTFGDPAAAWAAVTPEIIGYSTIRDIIILFVADTSGTKGWIYKVTYDPATREENMPGTAPILLYYSATLNFKKEWPIEALGRYENAAVQKVYWTDYNNIFRTINIADPNLNIFPVENIDIYPDIDYTQPILQAVTGGGQLNSGMYQIAYRLITSDGKETLISPPSNMIHIVTASETDTIAEYVGEPIKINTGKSISIEINTTAYNGNFEQIEFFALYYESPIATPVATSIEIVNIVSNSITLLYTGSEITIFDIELFTFTSKNFAFKTFKTVAQKDNYLIGANIKSSTIDVQDLLGGGTFDARTPRYDSTPALPHPLTGTPAQIDEKKLKNAFNISTATDANQGYNTDAHWDSAWHTGKQFRYKLNGTTLGGEGPNISYTFHLEPMTIDVDQQSKYHNIGGNIKYGWDNDHDLDDGYGIYPNPSFANNASPNMSGLLKGYKRGETYRFGIIFYTKKGEATYVEYIGDIKFPDISETTDNNPADVGTCYPLCLDTYTYNHGGAPFNGATIGFNLGIKFTLNFASCPNLLNNIESYQIVRVPRTNSDKRRLCTGILSPLAYQPTGSTTPNDYDFRVNNQQSVVHPFNARIIEDSTGAAKAVDLDYDSLSCFIDQQDPQTVTGTGTNIANVNIRAQHLSFFSPEISYNFEDIINIGTNSGNNPGFLMTGYYSHISTGGSSPIDVIESETISLPAGPEAQNLDSDGNIYDYGKKFRTCLPITFNSVENIKKLNDSTHFDMRDSTSVWLDTKTASWGTANNSGNAPVNNAGVVGGANNYHKGTMTGASYMRNYYVYTAAVSGGAVPYLNIPLAGLGIARAGTNISALTKQYTHDPLTTLALTGTVSSKDYFHVYGNTSSTDAGRIRPRNKAGVTGISQNDAIPIADLIIPRNEIYGGYTTSALESNQFIVASPVIDKTELSPIVFGGDVFITNYSIQKMMIEFNHELYKNAADYDNPITRTDLMVIESCVNQNLHNGATTTTGVKFHFEGQTAGGVETELYRQEDNNSFTNFGKLEPGESKYRFYAYNEVFSKLNEEVLFFIKPSSLTDLSLTNDIRAYLSSVKVNGENIDSWTQFAINDYYDVDDHGPINKIINFKDNIYFLQDQGIGVYAVNREAITTTDDGVPTQLGTAKGWGKHQYYSKEVGSIHQWAVAATDTGIYFFDAIHRKIYQLGQSKTGLQTSPLSELKGMHSYLQDLGEDVFLRKAIAATTLATGGDNPIINKGAHIGVDEINNEVMFTFLSVTERGTIESIVFDELANQFSTRLSIIPKIWINNGDTLLTSNTFSGLPTNLTNEVFIHNIGNWGEFYRNDTGCEITLVINPKADINKVLRFLEFNSIIRNDAKTITRTETITGFRITTEYQNTDNIYKTTPNSLTRIKRRFDKWRIKLPRDETTKGRFRSTHFLLTLYFDNDDNKELIMNKLVSYYDLQMF